MTTTFHALLLLCSIPQLISAQNIEIPKKWTGVPIEDLLQRTDVASLPFVARDQIARRIFPDFRGLRWTERRRILLDVEQLVAESERRAPRQPIVWGPSFEFADTWLDDGRQYYLFAFPSGLNLAVSIGQWENYVDVWVRLENRSEKGLRFDLDPNQISLSTMEPKVSTFARIDGDEIAKKIGKGAAWRAALVGGLGGMATQTETSDTSGTFEGRSSNRDNVSGTYTANTTTTRPDYQARRRSAERARAMRAEASAKSAAVQRTALRRNTVFPNTAESGFVYFKRNNSSKSWSVIQVLIGNVSFEIPVTLLPQK